MDSNEGQRNLEHGNVKEGGSSPLTQLLIHSTRSPSQMLIYYGGSLRVFNFITPEKAQAVMRCLSSAAAAREMTRAPFSESLTARMLVNQTLQQDLLSDIRHPTCRFQAELPIARRNSLQHFLVKRRERLVNRTPYAVKNTKETLSDRSSANGVSSPSSSPKEGAKYA